YHPSIGLFISEDGLVGKMGDIQNLNMYAYCANNPVMYLDSIGNSAISLTILGTMIGAIVRTTASGVIA
ncbi:MAG: hypothetical protein JXR38_06115, partial [Bacilli bacterium]|nr:hypothetical protein [Bacilli bacterium]